MITPDHIEQELSRLERCERFNDPTRRNWPWKEVWQEAMERHRAFLLASDVPPSLTIRPGHCDVISVLYTNATGTPIYFMVRNGRF